MIACHLSQPVT